MGIVIDFDLSTVLLASLLWLGVVTYLRLKKKKPVVYLLFFTIFFVYIVKVLEYTQFPIYLTDTMREMGRQGIDINLIPLLELTSRDFNTSVLNILLMVPFGFGLPFVTFLRFYRVVLAGFCFSVALETMQLLLGIYMGGTFRVVDINDVIFNTTGVVLGYLLFVGFMRLYCLVFRKWNFTS